MKKLLVMLICIGVLVLALVVGGVALLGSGMGHSTENLLETSVSPDGRYRLEAYRVDAGATVDYSVRVYLETDGNHKKIYDAYHESTVEITWPGDGRVSINGRTLDLDKQETYDWRKDT